MGLKVSGTKSTSIGLENTAKRSSRGSREALRKGAFEIRDRSSSYAPVDTGALESVGLETTDGIEVSGAHMVIEIQPGSFDRMKFEVAIDEDFVGKKSQERVGNYLVFMHEGTYKLGPRSDIKNRNNGGKVDRKFMERAFLELEPEIRANVEKGLLDGIGH